MIKVRGQVFEWANKEQSEMNSAIHSSSELKKELGFYSMSRGDRANQMRQELKCNLISIMFILALLSLFLYMFVLALRYLINTTQFYGNSQYCLESHLLFNGWTFAYRCLQCLQEYTLDDVTGLCLMQH